MNLINLLEYSYIQAKIKYILVNFINEEKYEEIKKIREKEELIKILNQTIYKKIFEGREITENNISNLLKKINYFHYEILNYIYKNFRSKIKKLLLLLLERYDIEKIIFIIRKNIRDKNDLKKMSNIKELLKEIEKEEYINKKKIEEKIKEYEEIIKECDNNNRESNILFFLEKKIIESYYEKLLKEINRFNKKEKEIIMKYIGADIDFEKIKFLLRIKFYYKEQSEKIEDYLMPYEYKIKNEDIKKIIKSENNLITEINQKLLNKYNLTISEEDKEKIKIFEQIEILYDQYIKRLIRKTFLYNQFSFGIILGLIYKLEREKKLITQKIKELELSK